MEYIFWCIQVITFKYLQLPILDIKQCITNKAFNVTALTVITEKDYKSFKKHIIPPLFIP